MNLVLPPAVQSYNDHCSRWSHGAGALSVEEGTNTSKTGGIRQLGSRLKIIIPNNCEAFISDQLLQARIAWTIGHGVRSPGANQNARNHEAIYQHVIKQHHIPSLASLEYI